MCNYVLYMYKYAINFMEVPEIIEWGNLIIERIRTRAELGFRRSTKVRYFTVFLYSWLCSIILATACIFVGDNIFERSF